MKIVIIGGGISGLASAYELQSQGFDVLLLEASARVGGALQTENRDGFLLEKGADSFLSEKPWAFDLAKKIGLESEIIQTQNNFRKSFIARGEKLIPLPEGFYLIAPLDTVSFLKSPLFTIAAKIRILLEPFIPKKTKNEDESVGAFIERRFGKEALRNVAQAMLAGIYTGDPFSLSSQATMPRFVEMEQQYGSVIRGLKARAQSKKEFTAAQGPRYSLFLSFRNGMESFVKTLASKLSKDNLKLNTAVKRLRREGQNWRVETENGEVFTADAVCLNVPAYLAGKLLAESCPEVSEQLNSISYESVATLNLGFDRKNIKHPLNGFGFVVPAIENKSVIACTFSSVKFENRAPENKALLRAFVGGAFGKKYFEMDDSDLIAAAMHDLSSWLAISGKLLFAELARYPKSMVQYGINHTQLVSKIETKLSPGIFLSGAPYHGVGIPDVIHDAKTKTEQIIQFLKSKSSQEKIQYAKG